jgi:hypothetical protein
MYKTEMTELCKQHMHKYVLIQTNDGMQVDGIIESVDDVNVYIAVPAWGQEQMVMVQPNEPQQRVYIDGFGAGTSRDMHGHGQGYGHGHHYPGYGYPSYGYPGHGYPGYGYPQYGFGRFRRLILPLAALTALTLLPYY